MSVQIFQQFAVLYGAFALNIVLIWRVAMDQTHPRRYCRLEEGTSKRSAPPGK